MTSKEIRTAFFTFFQEKGHQLVPSAPIVVKNDPTLMFTNAGMNQFKELFLGNETVQYPRIVDSQKCLRVSGKHNDLEEVGVDTYHHTMFEMLGNWSFGDFFKKEMIPWAWEFLTDVLKLDKDRIYVTIFEGDEEDNLEEDTEAYDIWTKIIATERIIKANKKDNFWEMGETGPCGPCSEIHIDLRDDSERKQIDGRTLVNEDHPQVIEVWNLVFIEYNRRKDKSLLSLPAKHVDTGMGFERLCMAMQGKKSNYDTDVFMPAIRKMEQVANKKYQATSDKKDIAFRVIVDHIRAIAFSIADGQLPSNTGAGYVIRRILRRAVRYGYSFLDLKQPFLYQLIDPLIKTLGDTFPEIEKQRTLIEQVIQEEENSFLRTLEKGIQLFDQYKPKQKQLVDGEFAFELYDTYGFPIDLSCLLAEEKGWKVDLKSFEKELGEQKIRSRAAGKIDTDDWVVLFEDDKEEFVGYDQTSALVQITRYRKVKQKNKSFYQLVFNLTPFYPEGGGQVGDTGYIEHNNEKISILDTKKENQLIVHFANKLPTDLQGKFEAVVNLNNRKKATANHTATHLLHQALREYLGEHITQKGSLVNPDYLRFDFSHFQKLETEEIQKIEQYVNARIQDNINLEEFRNMPIVEAKKKGAMALFGEKYGDTVRMIQFGESKELCGGTHVKGTGEIGFFAIVSESAVAAGVRRIEAFSGEGAVKLFEEQRNTLKGLKEQLKNPKSIEQAVDALLTENQELQKELKQLKAKDAKGVKNELLEKILNKNGIHVLIEEVNLDAASMKDIAFQLKGELDQLFMVLVSKAGGKPNIAVLLSENLVKEKGLDAGKIVRELATFIQGGGGGQAFFATAGGKKVEGIEEVLKAAEKMVVSII